MRAEVDRGPSIDGPVMDKRVFLLGVAGIAIAGLCAFRAMRTDVPRPAGEVRTATVEQPAPPCELYDQNSPSHLVRLEGYLGRHRVIVVFFDGRAGAHRSAVLKHLRDEWDRLRKAGVYVMAISTALPQENRKIIAANGEFPFPLLSDPDFHVHRAWGRFDEKRGTPLEGVFLVDRKGAVRWSPSLNAPQPLEDWKSAVDKCAQGT
jgi:mycoredoxin-dependent peroxiredoxin